MTNSTNDLTREHWLINAAALIEQHILMPAIASAKLTLQQPLSYKVSIGFPKGSSKAIGQCFARIATVDNDHNPIFITPTIDDSLEILAVLVHELIHAAFFEAGHKNEFVQVARKAGLEGKPTTTTAGQALTEKLLDIVDVLGDIPHSKIVESYRPKKKQTSRMIKVTCTNCDFSFRTSKKNIELMTSCTCNACGENQLSTQS